jgi:hypothetical protein
LSRSAGTSGRNGRANLRPKKRVIYPRESSTASPLTSGQGRHRLPVGSARTWLQRHYFSARCRSHQPPRGDVSRESSRISCGKPRSIPGTRATRHLRPRVASATNTLTATVEPTSTRGCAEATTPGVGDATTAGRIGVPRPNHPVRRLSAGPYDGRRSRLGSEPRLLSQSTRGRRGRNCGSQITGWPATWVERTMTTSSSATSPCSSPTPLEPSWNICLWGRSPTGTSWSKPSSATSRARTCALGTPGISKAAASSRESLSGTTSGDSRSSAPSCPTSPTRMSSARSSPAPPAATW